MNKYFLEMQKIILKKGQEMGSVNTREYWKTLAS